MRSASKKIVLILTRLANALIWMCVGLFFVWAIGALYYLLYLPFVVRVTIATLFAIAVPVAVWRSKNRFKTRAWIVAAIIGVYLLTWGIRASNDRNWAQDHARVADVEIKDGLVTIRNFRNVSYHSETDYEANFETRQFRLGDIDRVWFVVQRFSALEGIAHVFVTIGLREESAVNVKDRYFAISIEIRREEGESYDPWAGVFRNYEITHVIGDERDLVGVRTVHRSNDRVYMYPVNATPEEIQEWFVRVADRIQSLRKQPRFYHSLLNNCMNSITRMTYELTPEPINWMDPRIVLPGYSGKLAFEMGLVGDKKNGQIFEDLESSARIDEKARTVGITPSFSDDIRKKEMD